MLRDLQQSQARLVLAPHWQEHSRVHTVQEGHLELSLVYERASHIQWVDIHIHIHIHIHDVVRRTNTTLDVLLDSRIDEYWNVDGDRELSWPWSGFTQSTILNEKPPHGYTRRLTKVQATSRDDFLWLEVLSNMSTRSHKKEERQWEIIEKPKLDSARHLRGFLFHQSR